MRLIVLGATGMAGHKISRVLSGRFDLYSTLRSGLSEYRVSPVIGDLKLVDSVSVDNFDRLEQVVEDLRPQAVINCIGIIKQRAEAKAAIPSIRVNALFPHQLAELCDAQGIRLIHLSTDCVFSGRRGHYTERDLPDPMDLYGRTKLLGEVDRPGCLTIRTSIVGWEIKHYTSLLEWFASQRGQTIKGYRGAIYTGVTTRVLARLVGDLLEHKPDLSGIYHIASQPITKYDLLVRLRNALDWDDIIILPDDTFHCDRSLIGTRFEQATGWQAPTWDTMIAELASERQMYEQWEN